ERFVSNYLWSYKRPGAHGRIDDEMEEFLASERASALGSTYVRYLCGWPGMVFSDMSTAVEMACKNLRLFDYVGFLDEMGPFQAELRRLTQRRLMIGHENVGKRPDVYHDFLEGSLRARIMGVCAPDRDIWDA